MFHPGSVVDGGLQAEPIGQTVRRALLTLTGASDEVEAWRRFIRPGEVVGLKVNPVGLSRGRGGRRTAISSPETIMAVVQGLTQAGIAPKDIVLFDRYRDAFMNCGYHRLADRLGTRWAASSVGYDETQIDPSGYSVGDPGKEKEHGAARTDGSPGVSGYDPEHFAEFAYVHPLNAPDAPHSRRSYVSQIVTRQVDKIINLCVLKEHSSAGVTGALKNLSHGLVNNVSRTHAIPSLNQCRTFIPAVVALPVIRQKVVLHIMEAFVGIYQGGPFASAYAWEPKALMMSTDPVAMDRLAWDLIDAQRARVRLPALAKSGLLLPGYASDRDEKESFHRRQPEHVELAGVSGLGVFRRTEAEWRRVHEGSERGGRKLRTIQHRRIALGEPAE